MSRMVQKAVFLRITGVVQGVGFRPFIARLAVSLGLSGEVRNAGGQVELTVEGRKAALSEFVRRLKTDAPPHARIASVTAEAVSPAGFTGFSIRESDVGQSEEIYLPADLPVCDECLNELRDPENRRYGHPFISCASCGPRYSIIDRLPYDRENTSMAEFPLCGVCREEYTSPGNRRYHAETVSCKNCGPALYYRAGGTTLHGTSALQKAVTVLRHGGIVAVKGIGGYHLACSPFDDDSVRNLRTLKIREEKPFAVLFQDTASIESCCFVSEEEAELLCSPARPIVLLRRRKSGISQSVYRDSRFLGAFLPSNPLQHLLLWECGPLVMTSANLSGSPILKDEPEMFALEHPLLNGVLYHDRKIRVRLDDSVARVADRRPQILRYGRGYAPLPISIGSSSRGLLAAGGDLKASFCILKNGLAYPSQYIGDLEDAGTASVYRESVSHLTKLLRAEPEAVICDLHPGYLSAEFAEKTGLPVINVQHHFAHVASVMAEHRLDGPVIGVAFDGAGYGDDGAVWGGEFLLCTPRGYRRAGHLRYTVMAGGDRAAKEGWRAALAHLYGAGLERKIRDAGFPVLKAAIDHRVNTAESSSMGRLFDAVSSILGISQQNDYEGQSAILLENAAGEALEAGLAPYPLSFAVTERQSVFAADPAGLLSGLLAGLESGVSASRLALGFHEAAAAMTLEICLALREREKLSEVALCGGVFQNGILFERCLSLLRDRGFVVYYNQRVPPNDGGIALGQAFIGSHLL